MMEIICKLVMLAAGIYFLLLSYRMYQRGGKISTTTIALVGVLAIAGAQEWVQGFIKTEAIQLLIGYSAKLNTYHKTVGELEAKVRQHQGELDAHQIAISNQEASIIYAQSIISGQHKRLAQYADVINAQAGAINHQEQAIYTQAVEVLKTQRYVIETGNKVAEQQRHIDDTDYLVRNLFNNITTELFTASDTNRILFVKHGAGALIAAFKLRHAAIINSVKIMYDNNAFKPGGYAVLNTAATILLGDKVELWKNGTFYITYNIDARKTNLFEKLTADKKEWLENVNYMLVESSTNNPPVNMIHHSEFVGQQ